MNGHGINLNVLPGKEEIFDSFLSSYPPYSIALDGFVTGPSVFNEDKPIANFNHHEGCDRLSTRATCAIVRSALGLGLLKRFRNSTGPFANIYVNDCDEDVCCSVALLRMSVKNANYPFTPLINALVSLTDLMDMSAGAWPIDPDMEMMRKISWVYKPYRDLRVNGLLSKLDSGTMTSIIDVVGDRIMKFSLGQAELAEINGDYKVLGGGKGWSLVEENGIDARALMFENGIDSFVSVFPKSKEDRWRYSIGRRSVFVPFPLAKIYEALNKAEEAKGGIPSWGGSNTIGGSPRGVDSLLSPEEVQEIINRML